jgi:hypothetical protein
LGLSLRHLLLALIAAVIVYAIREFRRWRMAIRPRFPALTIEEALELWRRGVNPDPDAALLPEASVPERILEAVQRGGRQAEQVSLATDNPRQAIRQAILAQATLALKLEAIHGRDEPTRQALIRGYQPGMGELLRDAAITCHLTWRLLRHYARWKFDDAVPDDWFHRYMHLARPYIREKVRLAGAAVVEMDEGARQFAAVYDLLLADLQKQALAARPKLRFVRPDLP